MAERTILIDRFVKDHLIYILLLLLPLALPQQADAKIFRNSYINFDMPETWACEMKGKAYLCRYRISKSCQKDNSPEVCKKEIKKSREAVIVMAAKEKSKVDSLENYQNYFNEPKPLRTSSGNSTQSKVVHNKMVGINKRKWVDAMHLGSELPHYYTRYLATIKGNIAVLVTFTAHKLYSTKYSNQMFKSIKSLQVTASNLSDTKSNEIGSKILSHPIDIPDEFFQVAPQTGSKGGDSLSSLLMAFAIILAAAGVYIFIKSRKST